MSSRPEGEPPNPSPPEDERALTRGFEFSDRERLFTRVSHQRLIGLLRDPKTVVYSADLSQNDYGEFLFVTAERPAAAEPQIVTFFGLGLHDYRDRYLVDEWWWYESRPQSGQKGRKPITKTEVLDTIEARRIEVRSLAEAHRQSRAGEIFDLMADVSDDDSVLADYRDGLLDDLFDE